MPLRRVRSDSDILPTISASFTSPAPGTETYPTIVPSLTSLSLDASIVTSSSASTTPPASIGEEQTFNYKPLDTSVDSIRLLVLRGATSQESALSCSLLHTNFTEIPHYEALSCEWGSPLFTKSLQIDGANLRIGENLYEALVHIRLARHCILWIDAICTYVNRYQRKCHRNLRFGPLFSASFSFFIGLRRRFYLRWCRLISCLHLDILRFNYNNFSLNQTVSNYLNTIS